MSQSMAGETHGEGVMGEASARAQEAASLAQEKAGELKERGVSRLQSELDNRSNDLGGQMRSMARALRQTGSQDGEGPPQPAARLAAPAAEQLDRLGGYFERTSGDELLNDVEEFARRRPWMVAAAGALAGIAAARFVKASAERRATVAPVPRQAAITTGTAGTIGRPEYAEPVYSAR
jgi:hypothetical protein